MLPLFFSDKAPSEATFRGSEYLSYDLSRTGGEPIVSAQDSISLNFKTRQPNGLLFYTGKAYEKFIVNFRIFLGSSTKFVCSALDISQTLPSSSVPQSPV